MRFGKVSLAAVAAMAIAAAPVAAQAAAPAAKPVAAKVKRAAAKEESKIKGSAVIVGVLALAAVIGGIVIASQNNDDTPTSP